MSSKEEQAIEVQADRKDKSLKLGPVIKVVATQLGFDLIDVEGSDEFGAGSGFYAVFYSGTTASASIGFGTLALIDSSISYGNNTANRINPISFDQLDLNQFDMVEINFGASAALDNIRFIPIHEPATMLLLGSALIIIAGIGSKRPFKKKRQIGHNL